MPFGEILFCPECYRSYESGHGYCPEHGAHLVLLPGEESLVGTIVGERYRIEEELGGGGTAVTYRAAHTVIDRPIALKVFRRFLSEDESASRRFDADADAALQLKGRHSVQVYDSGRTVDGRPFLAREFVDGPTLAELIAGDRRLTPVRALRAALGAARAMEYAHARGVLHRGLSPNNIFLVEADGEEVARVADFGQAGALTGDDGISLRPEALAIRPLEYLSPEQAVGASCDVPADLYALGVVLFEALTGQPPFRADSPVELLLAHPQAPPPRFADVAPDVGLPAKVEDRVRTLLAKQARPRPASATELATELEVLLKDPSLAAPVAPAAEGPSRAESGRDAPPTGGVGAAESPSKLEERSREAPPTREPEAEHGLTDPVDSSVVLPPQKSKLPWIIGAVVVVMILAVVGLFASGVISQKGEEPAEESEAASPPLRPSDTSPLEGEDIRGEAPDVVVEVSAPDVTDTTEIPPLDGGEVSQRDGGEETTAPDVVEEVTTPDITDTTENPPLDGGEVSQRDGGEDASTADIQPEIIPDVIPDIQPEVMPDIQPEVNDITEDKKPPREDKKPPREDKKPPVEDKKPPVEDKKPPVEDKKPPILKKPDPVIAKPAGMGEEDYALAKDQVSWGRKNMKKQLWEMAILNFQQAKRMGLTDPAISRYIKECRNHMAIATEALERGHAAFLAAQWDEAIRQFQRARDHGEKNTTTFRMIEKSKEAKAKDAADKAQ